MTDPGISNAAHKAVPALLLWPGLAADERLFEPLLQAMPYARVPEMIKPRASEPLRDYAARYARILHAELPDGGHYVLGGFSFGGQLAMELAAALDPRPLGLILICGVRGTHQISAGFRRQQKIGSLIPGALAKRLYIPFAKNFAARNGLDATSTELLIDMARDIDPAFLNWSSFACATWPGPPPCLDVQIRHIHGEHDRIIPDAHNEADETIKGARHLITLTHTNDVVEFADRSMNQFRAGLNGEHPVSNGSPGV